jgi:hypothetical protein
MAEDGAIGNVSIRSATSRTCPTDGWLSVSAGQRALSERERFTVCEAAPEPEGDGSGAVVPGFDSYVRLNERSAFSAPVGLLGETVRDSGGTTLAAGPGAALGVADASGRVDHYADGPLDLTTERLEGVSLAAVELPELTRLYPDPPREREADGEEEPPEPDPEDVPEWAREEALADLDGRLRALERILPVGSSLMVVGVSMDTGPSQLTVALSGEITEDGFSGSESYLASESTRRPGLVALTDTTPTVLTALGLRATEPTSGRVWHLAERPPSVEQALVRLVDFNTAAVVVGAAIPGFFSGLVAFQLLIYAAAAYALHRYSGRQRGKRALVLSVTRIVALAGAAFPVASYLANLIPWWASGSPLVALLACVVTADALVVALAVAGPWRRSILGPMTVVAGATTAVLFLDLCFGANLQMNSPTGYSPIVGGRFYGIGNIAFATFARGRGDDPGGRHRVRAHRRLARAGHRLRRGDRPGPGTRGDDDDDRRGEGHPPAAGGRGGGGGRGDLAALVAGLPAPAGGAQPPGGVRGPGGERRGRDRAGAQARRDAGDPRQLAAHPARGLRPGVPVRGAQPADQVADRGTPARLRVRADTPGRPHRLTGDGPRGVRGQRLGGGDPRDRPHRGGSPDAFRVRVGGPAGGPGPDTRPSTDRERPLLVICTS